MRRFDRSHIKAVVCALPLMLLFACGADRPIASTTGGSTGGGSTTGGSTTGGSTTGGSTTGGSTGGGSTTGSTMTTETQDFIKAQCARAPGARLAVNTIADMQKTLRRRWALCSSVALFHQPQAGIEIGADDRYDFVSWAGGTLAPESGLLNTGTIEYLDTSSENGRPTIQVNFASDSGGTIVSIPVISDDPRFLMIDNEGVEQYLYVALP